MLLFSSSILINETTLFLHNRRFHTPDAKKNLTNSVQAWAQGLPAPPAKKQKLSKSLSGNSVTTSTEPTHVSKSVKSCTTIVQSTNNLPPPSQRSQPRGASLPSRGKKRQITELVSDSDTPSIIPIAPLPYKRSKAIELSSDPESDRGPPCPSQKHRKKAARAFKNNHTHQPQSHHGLPSMTHVKQSTATSSCKKTLVEEVSTDPGQDTDDSSIYSRKPSTKGHSLASHHKKKPTEEPSSDSDSQTQAQALPPPKHKSHATSRVKSRQVDGLSEVEEEADVPSMLYGGLEDEDDTAEQKAAVASPIRPQAAAKRSKVRHYSTNQCLTHISQASLKVKSEITASRRNSNLPHGTLDQNRWSSYFLPTFLKFVGGMRHEIWALDEKEAIAALQMIWNRVYSGEKPAGGAPIVHVVGYEVYSVVSRCSYLIIYSANFL